MGSGNKFDRAVQVAGILIAILLPAVSFGFHVSTVQTAQAGDIRNVQTVEADHYQEIKGELQKQDARGTRMEDKLDRVIEMLHRR